MPFRMFNLHEVAEYLHLAEDAIEDLARRGEMPCERQGGRLMFRHMDVDAWASRRLLGLPDERLAEYHKRLSAAEGRGGGGGTSRELSASRSILDTMTGEDRVALGLTARGKAGIIEDMVRVADATGLVCDADDLKNSLLEREKLCSTALPGGFALLHPRNHEPYMFADSFLAVGRTVGRIFFGAPDGEATDVFFLICCQDDRLHLHVLARLCMMCHHTGVLEAVRAAETPSEVVSALAEAEAAVLK